MTGHWRIAQPPVFHVRSSGGRSRGRCQQSSAGVERGREMLAAGGNAIDAAIATLFALTVVSR